MAGYLEAYGETEERRSRFARRLVIAVASALGLIVLWSLFYVFWLSTYPAKRTVHEFIDDLRKHDYHSAYRIWGCSQPCPDYSYDRFLEDWGPKSEFANADAIKIARSELRPNISAFVSWISGADSCHNGVIITLKGSNGSDVPLWYARDTKTLGFSPWPICAERIPAPAMAP